jgi:predicted O-methyltransferase YrrM
MDGRRLSEDASASAETGTTMSQEARDRQIHFSERDGGTLMIGQAITINGWMLSTELEWLAEQAKRHRNIVEVGSWMGRSTRALADSTRGNVTAVDTWKGSDEDEHRRILKGQPESWLFDQFSKNLADHIKVGKVIPYQLTSSFAASIFRAEGDTYDMIFIDASHDHENVKADLAAWYPLLAPGGLFCGHDFNKNHPGVMQAVTEFFPEPERVKKMAGGSIWYL